MVLLRNVATGVGIEALLQRHPVPWHQRRVSADVNQDAGQQGLGLGGNAFKKLDMQLLGGKYLEPVPQDDRKAAATTPAPPGSGG